MKLLPYFDYKNIIQATIMFLLAFGLIFISSKQIQIVVSNSDSLSYHVFLRFNNISPKLNHYSLVKSDWYKKQLIKKVVGMKGDRIWYDPRGRLFVNQQLIGKPHKVASDGRKLHPIKAQVIPEGSVFLAGTNDRSFDSRYQELGLVRIDDLKGLVIPLF